MKSYAFAIFFAFILAFVLGSGWFALFGYDPYISMPENIVAIYTNISFWKGLAIWTVLYGALVTIPLTYIKTRATES